MENYHASNIIKSKENILTDCSSNGTAPLNNSQWSTRYGSTIEEDALSTMEADNKNTNNSIQISSDLNDRESRIQNGSIIKQDGGEEPLVFESSNKNVTCCTILKSLKIEPFVFTFVFAYYINKSCITNMIMDKGCLYTFNFTKDVCMNLSGHRTEKSMVEVLGNDYTLYSNLMQIFGAIQTMFIAPWSDKHGRKIPMAFAVIGMILSEVGLMLCSYFFDSALYFIILSRIPSEFFGGFICAMAIVYSHASEVSSKRLRAWKYAFVEIALGLGMGLGGLVGGLMFNLGYVYIFFTALLIHCVCLPYLLLCVQETTGLDGKHTCREKLRDLFVLESFFKGWKVAVRKRENNERAILLMLFASMCVVVLTWESLSTLGFVFIHHWYDWDQGKYNTINTYFIASTFLFMGFGMPLLFRKFRVTDSFMGMIGVISMIGKYALIGFSELSIYLFYIGNIVGSMYSLSMFQIRTIISKVADEDEVGRVFAFLATCEAIFPMLGSILVTKVFNATMDTFPNVTYMMATGFLVFPLMTFGWIYIRSRGITVTPTASR